MLPVIQRHLEDAFDTRGADNARHAHRHVAVVTVLAVQGGTNRVDGVFIEEDRARNGDGRLADASARPAFQIEYGSTGIVNARGQLVATSIGEELGVTGLMAVIVLFFILTARGMRTSLGCRDDFGKLMVAGLSFTLALQVFAIIGGVTRLLPLTGLTTPFMSQGGSSLIANWVIVAIIMIVSHRNRKPADDFTATVPAPDPQQAITGGTR